MKLKELVNRKIGYGIVQPGASCEGGVPVIKAGNIIAGLTDVSLLDTTAPENDAKYKRTKLVGGELVITIVGSVGKTAIVPEEFAGCNLVRATALIDINNRDVALWVKYYIDSPAGQNYINQNLNTTVQPTLNIKLLEDMDVPMPSSEVRKNVVSILSSIDSKIKNNTQINRNLSEQFSAIVDHFIEGLDEYEVHRLDEVADCQNGHAFYKEGYDEEGAFVIDLGNVDTSANFVYTNADKYISTERYNQSKMEKFRVFKDDLVMVMTDRKSTMELLGKTGKVYKDGYYILNQRMYRIRANAGMNVNYLYAILNSTAVCNGLKEKALGSVQKYVNTGMINEIEIKVPSAEKMEELSALVNPISTQMETYILENEALTSLRDSLLPKLMSGELDVSDLGNKLQMGR